MNSLVRLSVKDLGAYYTPQTIADILADWVVQTGNETVLEPSIGDGALLRASVACAERKFAEPSRLTFVGCDLDAHAIAGVRRWIGPQHNLRFGDFLELDPATVRAVEGIISNPPFTRNHALPAERRSRLRQRFQISGAAGLWVPFLLHAMSFLAAGGRMAAVVPASAVFTRYGQDALKRICGNFEHVEVMRIDDRTKWSSHAEERGAILLAKNFGSGPCQLLFASNWSASRIGPPRCTRITPSYFHEAQSHARSLAELATLSIGVVTGCNKVFLMSEADRDRIGVDIEDLTIVAAKSRHIRGLAVTAEELHLFAKSGERTWMLTPKDIAKSRSGVRRRLAQISPQQRRSVLWLNKRSPWWKIDAGPSCDAIFTYMNDQAPRIVIAGAGVWCTNTLHRVRFHADVDDNDRMIVSLSMISSFGQLAAERLGRSYGGGVLKFELTDARRFPILKGSTKSARLAFTKADTAMRAGDAEAARKIADAFLLPAVFGDRWQSASSELNSEAVRLRILRRAGGEHE